MPYPNTLYSIKIEYIEDGEHRAMRSSYHDQSCFLYAFASFHERYKGCLIESISLIKVVFTSKNDHGPEIEVGKIPVPVGYDWLK